MFTGIIETVGEVTSLLESTPGTYRLELQTPLAQACTLGNSIAVNGVCLTVITQTADNVGFDILAETSNRTNLSRLETADLVNLERPLSISSRFDGHIVQGHVDTTTRVLSITVSGQDRRIELRLPEEFEQYVVSKGSVAVDGVSLTVSELKEGSFAVWIIPHTWKVTNFHQLSAGSIVNLEFDMIAKYVERMLLGQALNKRKL
ncbi:MAG: riboflavin synthase [Verrucomicrobia bacterium]|nr:riboflavin synthase [Verrucomicrobiota bacterium]